MTLPDIRFEPGHRHAVAVRRSDDRITIDASLMMASVLADIAGQGRATASPLILRSKPGETNRLAEAIT